MASFSTYAFFQSAVEVPICSLQRVLLRYSMDYEHLSVVLSVSFSEPIQSLKFLIQFFIACFEGNWPWRPKLKKLRNSFCAHSKLSLFL